jgi:RNA polymerase sigma-70 factor (ECF subfamily)
MAVSTEAAPRVTASDGERWRAFEAAIAEHQSGLHAFAYRIVGGRAEVEDVLQDAFVKAFRAVRAGHAPPELARPWLYRVVFRCCVDELRRRRRTAHDVLDDVDGVRSPEGGDAGLARAVSEALLRLPPRARAAVLLVDVHGLSYEEAAAALELPRGTIASRLNHGRQALRDVLREYAPQKARRST